MRAFFRIIFTLLKWLVLAALFVEILSFAVITASNYLIYGNLREGPKAVYDPYALYLQGGGLWPTAHVEVSRIPKNNRTLWFFGGSTMRASSAPYAASIPSLVAKRLNDREKTLSGSLRFNCVNFGVNGFNSLLEVKYLQKALIEYPIRPNLVVFYDGANDANYFAVQKTPYAHEGRERAQAAVESYYKSGFGMLKPLFAALNASFTRELYNKLTYAAAPIDPDSPELREFVDLTVKRYDHIHRMLKAFHADFLLFLQPVYWSETCAVLDPDVEKQEKETILGQKTFPHLRENSLLIYTALQKALAGKPYFVNLQNALCSRTAPVYTHDGVHNTDQGRGRIVDAMLPALEKRLDALGR